MVVGRVSRGCQVVVIGAGPGGYVAAIRLAQLGKDVILVEKEERLGGVCLNEGCIPSKALIHVAELAEEARSSAHMGVHVSGLAVDQGQMVQWKDGIVRRLTGGVQFLCEKNGVEIVHGAARFLSDRQLEVASEDGGLEIQFEQAVIATGSSPMVLGGFEPDGQTVVGSREMLSLAEVPERLVVIGGGYIGLELGSVYARLGSDVSVVEMLPSLIPGQDPEVGKALEKRLSTLGVHLYLGHRAVGLDRSTEPATVRIAPEEGDEVALPADVVMVSIGRVPNSGALGLDEIGVAMDERGFITVSDRMETSVPGIYAIGDVVGEPLLAHKAYLEAKVAAEVICGEPSAFDTTYVPAVIYTDPEVAWVGLSEKEATERGIEVVTGTFPFTASGRAMTLESTDGFVKTIAEASSKRLLGVIAVGRGVSELIAEAALALEMGSFLEDLALTIHPHPTMSEGLLESVEMALGQAVHALNR